MTFSFLYCSCGNRVFAVDSKGKLLWKTDILKDSPGYPFNTRIRFSPAIVPNINNTNLLVLTDSNSSYLFAVSTSNGSILGSYKVPVLVNDNGIAQPPFVAGKRVYWIRGQYYYNKCYLYSIPINQLLGKYSICDQ